MGWHDEAEQGLPPQRHREPATLRQDILDELTDHLALAAHRESESGSEDEQKIRTRVLEQFGNPAAIARALWWDAMKETVVKDWIQISINAIICISVVGFMALFYRQMQSTNTQLINALNDRPSAAEELYPSIEFVLHRGSIDGPVAEGLRVSLEGRAFNEESTWIREESDHQGHVKFGPVRAGQYNVAITDGETGLRNSRSITLYSGDETKTVHVPVPPTTKVSLDMMAPAMQHVANSDIRLVMSMTAVWQYEGDYWSNRSDRVVVTTDGIFRTHRYPTNNDLSQLEERITHSYGNRISFGAMDIAKVYNLPEGGKEKLIRLQDYRYSLHYQGASFSHDLQPDQANPVILNLPEEVIKAYEYNVRMSSNRNIDLPDRIRWCREVISNEFKNFIIDQARPVEQHIEFELSDDQYTLHAIKDSFAITEQLGSIFSMRQAPKSVPEGYKILLVYRGNGMRISEPDVNLGAHLVTSHVNFGSEVPTQVLAHDQIREPIWRMSANSIDANWAHDTFQDPSYRQWNSRSRDSKRQSHENIWIVDLTDEVNNDPNYEKASGILFKWETSSQNALKISLPEKGKDYDPLVWLIMKPIARESASGADHD